MHWPGARRLRLADDRPVADRSIRRVQRRPPMDSRRCRASPFGGPIAHGYLALPLLAPTALEVFIRPAGITQAFNYGLDRVRFTSPVKVGARVRNQIKLLSAEEKGGSRVLLSTDNTVETEGEDRPALTAVALAMIAR